MKRQPRNQYIAIALYGLAVIATGALFVLLLLTLRDYFLYGTFSKHLAIFMPFVYGGVIAYLLNPLLTLFETKVFRKWRGFKKTGVRADARFRRMVSLFATLLTALIVITIIALMVFPQVGTSVNQLANRIVDLFSPADSTVNPLEGDLETLFEGFPSVEPASGYETLMNTKLGVMVSDGSHRIQEFVSRFGIDMDMEGAIQEWTLNAASSITVFLGEYFQTILNTTANILISTARQVLNIVLSIVIAVYILSDKENLNRQIKKLLFTLLPIEGVHRLTALMHKAHDIFTGFIVGKLLDSLIIGLICFFCMTLFRIEYPMLISVIVGITNIIPFFGPFIGAIPSIIFLTINDPGQGLWFTVFIIILQQVDGNIIGPKILGSSLGLSSFWVIFAILVMNGLMGPVGMFIGVPLFTVIYTIIKDFSSASLSRKGLALDEAGAETLTSPPTPEREDKDEPSLHTRFVGMIDKLAKNIQHQVGRSRREDANHDDYYDDDDNFKI
ncbi:MAG: AI-2E family transporter [Clostridiales bacterium]|jgi:predicted PurR-regulated permease PerM|nr:AI-2E family transporter [Clostridiales bacterium]